MVDPRIPVDLHAACLYRAENLERERDELRVEVERLSKLVVTAESDRLNELNERQAEIVRLKTLIVGLLHADEDAFEQARKLVNESPR